MQEDSHEIKLIQALNRLRYSLVDQEFSGVSANTQIEVKKEQHFAFSIGQFHFVVRADSFCAVFADVLIASMPNAPASLFGLSNIRGTLTPVYQLYSSLNEVFPNKLFVFCIGKGEKAIGLLIDALPASLALHTDELLPNDESVVAQLSEGFYWADNKKWHLINGETIASTLLAFANKELKQSLLVASTSSVNQTAYL